MGWCGMGSWRALLTKSCWLRAPKKQGLVVSQVKADDNSFRDNNTSLGVSLDSICIDEEYETERLLILIEGIVSGAGDGGATPAANVSWAPQPQQPRRPLTNSNSNGLRRKYPPLHKARPHITHANAQPHARAPQAQPHAGGAKRSNEQVASLLANNHGQQQQVQQVRRPRGTLSLGRPSLHGKQKRSNDDLLSLLNRGPPRGVPTAGPPPPARPAPPAAGTASDMFGGSSSEDEDVAERLAELVGRPRQQAGHAAAAPFVRHAPHVGAGRALAPGLSRQAVSATVTRPDCAVGAPDPGSSGDEVIFIGSGARGPAAPGAARSAVVTRVNVSSSAPRFLNNAKSWRAEHPSQPAGSRSRLHGAQASATAVLLLLLLLLPPPPLPHPTHAEKTDGPGAPRRAVLRCPVLHRRATRCTAQCPRRARGPPPPPASSRSRPRSTLARRSRASCRSRSEVLLSSRALPTARRTRRRSWRRCRSTSTANSLASVRQRPCPRGRARDQRRAKQGARRWIYMRTGFRAGRGGAERRRLPMSRV